MRFNISNRTIQQNNTPLGVQGDNGVETIEFVLPQYYGGIDLNQGIAYGVFRLPDKTEDFVKLGKSQDGENLILTWLVGSQVTEKNGIIEFGLKISGLNGMLWGSKITNFIVERSIPFQSPQQPYLRSARNVVLLSGDNEVMPILENPVNEPPITVTERKINIPAALQTIAVQNDANSETVQIQMPRHYDGHDLQLYTIYLKTIMPDDNGRDDIVLTPQLLDSETLVMDWTLKPPQTSYQGKLGLQIYVIGTRSDGKDFKWETLDTSITIARSLDANPVGVSQPSVFDQFLMQMTALKDRAVLAETNSKASETKARTSETNAKTHETNALNSKNAAANSAAQAINAKTAADAAQKSAQTSATASKQDADRAKQEADRISAMSSGYEGWYPTPERLREDYPTSSNGRYAVVGSTCSVWTWDDTINDWRDTVYNAGEYTGPIVTADIPEDTDAAVVVHGKTVEQRGYRIFDRMAEIVIANKGGARAEITTVDGKRSFVFTNSLPHAIKACWIEGGFLPNTSYTFTVVGKCVKPLREDHSLDGGAWLHCVYTDGTATEIGLLDTYTTFTPVTLTTAANKTIARFWIKPFYGGSEFAVALDESYITPDILPCPNYPVFLQGVGQPYNHKPFETIANRCIARKAETGSTQRCEIATVDGKRCWIYQILAPTQTPDAGLIGAFAVGAQYIMTIVAKCISGGANINAWIGFGHQGTDRQSLIKIPSSQTTWGTFTATSLSGSTVSRITYGWDDGASVWAIALDESYITPALLPCANNPPSSADYGQLTVKALGKNLLNLTQVKAEIPGGATVSNVSANSITVAKPNENAVTSWRGYLIDVLPHAQYTLSFVAQRLTGTTANGPGSVAIYSGDRGTTALGGWMAAVNSNGSAKLTLDSGANNQIWLVFYAQVVTTAASIGPSSIKYSNIQLEYGSTATDYTPYVSPGTSRNYTLQKPLYALPNGPHDELDVARGKIIRRLGILEMDGTTKKLTATDPLEYRKPGYSFAYVRLTDVLPGGKTYPGKALCTHIARQSPAMSADYVSWCISSWAIGVNLPNSITGVVAADNAAQVIAKLNAYLAAQKAAGTPLTFVLELKEPVEEDVQPNWLPVVAPVSNVFTTDQLMPDVHVEILNAKPVSRSRISEDTILFDGLRVTDFVLADESPAMVNALAEQDLSLAEVRHEIANLALKE